jgi:hypothetical protein
MFVPLSSAFVPSLPDMFGSLLDGYVPLSSNLNLSKNSRLTRSMSARGDLHL